MRRFSALVIAVSACSGAAPQTRQVQRTAPPPSVAAPQQPVKPVNTTGLTIESLVSPVSPANVRIVAPRSGERLTLDDARRYDVRWASEQLDPDALGVDIALDAHRPRRLPASQSLLTLGLLVSTGEQLTAGEHWLFAAPIAASGLVPRAAAGAAPAAVAVKFQIGDVPSSAAAVGDHGAGAVWLRKPEGTYNGPSSEHVLFDALAFAEDGAPRATPCRILVRGALNGELAVLGPFSLLALKSGDYEISASAPGAARASARLFTVNSELGRPR